jgi:TPP-dependent indolepyruvate ferredoxin oxidoreductase alpha subunit
LERNARIEALRNAPLDSWIALSDDESCVVAQGASYQEVAAQLDALGDDTAVILKTPPSWAPFAV